MKRIRVILIVIVIPFLVFPQYLTPIAADTRVKSVNNWQYLDERIQFFYPVVLSSTFTMIDSISNSQIFSVGGYTSQLGDVWDGQGTYAKDYSKILAYPSGGVEIIVKNIKSTSVTKLDVSLGLQNREWGTYFRYIEVPLNGAPVKLFWDTSKSQKELGAGILRMYIAIRGITTKYELISMMLAFSKATFVDLDGSKKVVDFDFTGTDVQSEPTIPTKLVLEQNYPNPFNPTTSIKFSVPITQYVSLKVYDVLGTEVATLVDEEKFAGNYNVQFNGSSLASGVYLYRLQAGSFVQTKKLMLMK